MKKSRTYMMIAALAAVIAFGGCAEKSGAEGVPTPATTVAPVTLPAEAPTAVPTEEPEVTEVPTPEVTPEVTESPEPEVTEAPAPEVTPEITETPTPEVTPEVPAPEVTEVPTPEVTPEITESPEPEITPEPTSAPTAEPTAVPTATPTPVPVETKKISDVKIYQGKTVEAAKAVKGDVVLFGAYEQDGKEANGAERIAWRVLDAKDNRLLLVSVYVLDAAPYHNQSGAVTWNNSSLKKWLAAEFYEAAFTKTEQSSLEKNEDGAFISLLSVEQLGKYFNVKNNGQNLIETGNAQLAAEATAYAESRNAWISEGKTCWWLRTEGKEPGTAVEITEDGSVYLLGTKTEYEQNGVRPVISLELQ